MLKVFAGSREDRLAALGSEVRRLKMMLAARDGEGSVVELLAGQDEDLIVKELQGRLK